MAAGEGGTLQGLRGAAILEMSFQIFISEMPSVPAECQLYKLTSHYGACTTQINRC